jgi:hypothetical protein
VEPNTVVLGSLLHGCYMVRLLRLLLSGQRIGCRGFNCQLKTIAKGNVEMQRRTVAGLAVGTGTLCLFGSGLLVEYGSGWTASALLGFGSSVLIDIGDALFLVPAILWLERRLTMSIVDAQRSITKRHLDSSSVNLLGPGSPWERVHFELARLGALYPTERIELHYPTFHLQFQSDITFSNETAQPGSRVSYTMMSQDTDKTSRYCSGLMGLQVRIFSLLSAGR